MTKIWRYRFDTGFCGSEGTARCTPVRIWIGFWPSCHGAEPLSPWYFREYRYRRGSTRHMQSWQWRIDWPYVPGFWRASLQCWSRCSLALCEPYAKLLIRLIMRSATLWEAHQEHSPIIKWLYMILYSLTSHNNIANNLRTWP